MPLFDSPPEAFLTITAITAGACLVCVVLVIYYNRRMATMRREHEAETAHLTEQITKLRTRVDQLETIVLAHFPRNDASAASVDVNIGTVRDSTVLTAGRDARSE